MDECLVKSHPMFLQKSCQLVWRLQVSLTLLRNKLVCRLMDGPRRAAANSGPGGSQRTCQSVTTLTIIRDYLSLLSIQLLSNLQSEFVTVLHEFLHHSKRYTPYILEISVLLILKTKNIFQMPEIKLKWFIYVQINCQDRYDERQIIDFRK